MAPEPGALRNQHTRLTRNLIMSAVADVVAARGPAEFSVHEVAQQAGVSHRTVYRHYPSRQALLEALAEWLTEEFERRIGRLESELADDLPGNVILSFRTMDALSHYMRAYVSLMAATEETTRSRERRSKTIRARLEEGPAAHLAPDAARAVSALLRTMASAATWYQFTQQLGVDGDAAGRTVSWAMKVLLAELEAGGGPVLGEDAP